MNIAFSLNSNHYIDVAGNFSFAEPSLHATRCLQFHVFLYVTKGEWSIIIDNEKYYFRAGDVVIMPAGIKHLGLEKCTSNTEGLFVHYTKAEEDNVNDLEIAQRNFEFINLPFVLHVSSEKIEKMFLNFIQLYNSDSNNFKKMSSSLFDVFILELHSFTSGPNIKNKIDNILVKYNNQFLTNNDFADMLDVSPKTLQRSFIKESGKTLHQYQIEYKLNLAKSMLYYFELNVNEVAEKLGFYDASHLSKLFKNKYKISPKKFLLSSKKQAK